MTTESVYELIEKRVINGFYLPGQQLPTTRQMAEEYGLSIGTISTVLKRLSVRGLVELQHGRGAFVANFRNQSANKLKLGLLFFCSLEEQLTLEHSPFGYAVFEGCRQFCREGHYNLVLKPIRGGLERVEALVTEISKEKFLDGMILMYGSDPANAQYLEHFRKLDVPMVLIDNPWRQSHDYSYIAGDNLQLGIRAADYLVKLGHRNLLYLLQDGSERCFQDLFLGFKTALQRHGVELSDENVVNVGKGHLVSRDTLDKIVARVQQPEPKITAVCGSDMHAMLLLEKLREIGLGVPDDLSVMGSTGSNVGSHCHPSLSTVTCGLEAMGQRACDMLCQLIEHPESGPLQEVLETHVVERESTAPLQR